jgi:methanogenic corrinoid protein MtbC1
MPEQQKIVEALQETGLHEQVRVMIGGAPTTPIWAEKIGAHGYAEDAIAAVALAKRLVGAAG